MNGNIIRFEYNVIINSLADLLYNSYRKATYYEDGSLQCSAGKRRSIIDLALLCNYYKLDYSEDRLDNILRNVGSFIYYLEDEEGYFTGHSNVNRCFFCKDIKRRVISVDELHEWTLENIKEALDGND